MREVLCTENGCTPDPSNSQKLLDMANDKLVGGGGGLANDMNSNAVPYRVTSRQIERGRRLIVKRRVVDSKVTLTARR
jgi:hypothetical protein